MLDFFGMEHLVRHLQQYQEMVRICGFLNAIDYLVKVCTVQAREELETSDHSLFVVYRELREWLGMLWLMVRIGGKLFEKFQRDRWRRVERRFWILQSGPDFSMVDRCLYLLEMLIYNSWLFMYLVRMISDLLDISIAFVSILLSLEWVGFILESVVRVHCVWGLMSLLNWNKILSVNMIVPTSLDWYNRLW